MNNRPGMFTGSGFPMRFADEDGALIDVYQAATQLTDESGIDIPTHIPRCSTARSAATATTASSPRTCTPTGRPRGRAGDRRRGAAPRRPGRVGRADARLARRPQRLVVRRAELPAGSCGSPSRRRRRARPRGDDPGSRPAAACRARPATRRWHPLERRREGHRLRGLRRRRRGLRSDVPHCSAAGRLAARHDDHRVRGDRELGARCLHVQRVRRAGFECRMHCAPSLALCYEPGAVYRPRSAVSTYLSGAGRGRYGGRASIPRPPSARSPVVFATAPGGQLPPPGGESGSPV